MAGYIRQSSFVDGDTITAALFNNEYNQLLNAFNNATGHAHDGTAAEGPVIGLIGDAGETAPNNKVLIDTTNNFVEFYVQVSSAPVQQLYIADGAIIPVTDSDIDLGTSSLYFKNAYIDSITTTGNIDVGGNLTVTGTTTFNGGTITMGDAATDNVVFGADIDSNIIPDDDNTYDLGSTSQEWRNLYIDGTANIDSLVADTADINGGTIDGSIIGGTTAAAITGTAITGTSFVIGSADISEAELETIDGVTAGTVAASKAIVVDANKDITGGRNITITGEIDAATLDISGNADIDGTLEADAITINGITLAETIADTVGAMVSSNTETGIAVSYDDADNTLDFVIGDDAIVQSMIADDAIDSQHYVDGSIDLVHMSINSIDSDQYVDGSIDLVHMSANSVDSDQYVDGSIDLIHMSANSVDSDQYVDGSIDTVHLADDAVTGAKLADNIDIAGTLDVTGILTADSNVVVAGNLTVNGTTTTLNTATLDVEDKNITINYGAGDTSASANGAGITIQDAVDASNDATILWDTTNDEFDFSHAINVAGNIAVSGTVDGRDVATDGTKLDGIEASATADQTAAEIRTAVEAATDSNVFTDADHTKLNAIEALADVTDATNVTAAGALMDSELTAIASVKALNQGVATTDSPTFVNVTGTSLDISGDIDVDGTTNLDVVDIDGAVDMASTLTVGGTTNDGTTLTQITQSGTGRGLSVNRNVASATRALVNLAQTNGSGGADAVLDIQQATSASRAIIVTADGSTDRFSVYGTGALVTTPAAGGHAIFNEGGVDADFRVESDTKTHAFFVEGSSGNVGINNSSPASMLDVIEADNVKSHVSARYNTSNRKIGFNVNNSNGQGFLASNANQVSASDAATYDIASSAAKVDFQGGIELMTAVSGLAGATISYVNNLAVTPTTAVFNEGGADIDFRVESNDNANMLFVDGGNNRVGIGKAAASQPFEVGVSSVFDTAVIVNETGGDHDFRVESDDKTHMLFVDGGANQVTIGSSDLIGTLSVNGSASDGFLFSLVGGGYQGLQTFTNTAVGNGQVVFEPITVPGSGVAQQYTSFKTRTVGGGSTVHNVIIDGSLSKGSGSFKIDHPLPSKKDTHHLIHSFIEGPQADNIYRGKVDLVAGSATANIDTVAGMTEGTFVALNREVQCFTTNESNWDAVKGSVSGNILTIESENSESTATISWLVIGERKDQHMYDTDWTDENGKVIVEPIKS
jgi:cytoskeletal protein CcmA (bactofilin family)